MSRHRDVRNMDADDYEDDYSSYGSSYGSSYVEEGNLSTSMEKYMYRRMGSTPKMGHFVLGRSDSVPEESEHDDPDEEGHMRARSDSETSSNGLEDLDEDRKGKLAKCLEEVLDVVGDTMSEQVRQFTNIN